MSYEVRQLSFGEILDQAFQVLKDNFVLLISIMAVFYVPYALIMSLFTKAAEPGAPPGMEAIVAGLVGMLIMLLIAPVTQLAATRASSEVYLNTPPTLGEAYKTALKLYFPYMTTCLLVALGVMGATILFVIPGIYLGIKWALVGPVAVVEGTYGRAALKRSSALVKGLWWRTFGVLFVVALISGVVASGVNLVLSSIPLLGALCSGAIQAISAAFGSVALLVLYVDLRCRHEDFDLQRLATQVGSSVAVQSSGPGPVRI